MTYIKLLLIYFFLTISTLFCLKQKKTKCDDFEEIDKIKYDSMLNVAKSLLVSADSLIVRANDKVEEKNKHKNRDKYKEIILSPDRPFLHTLKIKNHEQQID